MFKYNNKWYITTNDIINELQNELKNNDTFTLDSNKCRSYLVTTLLKGLKEKSLKILVPLEVAKSSKYKAKHICNTRLIAYDCKDILDLLSTYSGRIAPSYSKNGLSDVDKRYLITFIIKLCKNKRSFKETNTEFTILSEGASHDNNGRR